MELNMKPSQLTRRRLLKHAGAAVGASGIARMSWGISRVAEDIGVVVGETTGQKFGMQFREFSPVSNWLWISSARGATQNWFSRQSRWPERGFRGRRVSPVRWVTGRFFTATPAQGNCTFPMASLYASVSRFGIQIWQRCSLNLPGRIRWRHFIAATSLSTSRMAFRRTAAW